MWRQIWNDKDLLNHKERVHAYGEICNLYPCEECGFQGSDIITLKKHIEDIHLKNLYQTLKNVDIEEESEDEYIPSDEDWLLPWLPIHLALYLVML